MSYNRNKYKIVLFKNCEKCKTFFSSNSKKSILSKYNKLIVEKKPKLVTEYISRKKVMFELSIITTETSNESIFVKDDMGRTKEVSLGGSNYSIIKLLPYWKEEFIYDHQNKNKIPFNHLIRDYLPVDNFKQVFTLNNKLIIQQENIFNLFSLKNITDANRLLRIINVIELEFHSSGRYDCLFVSDTSTVQRKQLYDLLVSVGYKRDFLRKQYTY